MRKKEQTRAYVMHKSGWSGFSVLLYVLIGILIPLLLLAHVFLDYPKYIEGYGLHAKTTFEQAIAAYEEEIETLNSKKSATETSASQAIDELKADIKAVEAEIKSAETELINRKNIVETIETEIKALDESIQTKETEIATKETEIATIETEIDALNSELASLQSEKLSFQKTLNGLLYYRTEETDAIPDLEAQIAEIEENIATIETEIAEITENIATIETEIANKATEIVQANQAITDANQALDAITTEINTINSEIDNVTTTLNGLKTQKTDYENSRSNLQAEIIIENQAIDAEEKKIGELKKNGDNIDLATAKIAYEIVTLEIDIEKLKAEEEKAASNSATTDIETLLTIQKDIANKSELLNKKKAEMLEAYGKHTDLALEIARCQAEINIHNTNINEKTTKINEITGSINDLKDPIQQTTDELNSWKSQLKEKESEQNAKNVEIDNAYVAIENANTAKLELNEQIEAANAEISDKQTQIANLQKQLNGLDETEDADQIADLNGQIENKEKEIANKATEIDQANANLQTKQDEKTEIESQNADLAVQKAEKELDLIDPVDRLESQRQILEGKQLLKTEKETTLSEKISSLDMEIKTQSEAIATLQRKIETLNERLKLSGVALVKEFYSYNLGVSNPYTSNETNQGLLTTTKLLFETAKLGVNDMETLNVVFLIFALTVLIVSIFVVIAKASIAKRTQYVLCENVIEYQLIARNKQCIKFVLTKDAKVTMQRSLKGSIFGYGTLKITQGNGSTGEVFTMCSVKDVKRAKSSILLAISKYANHDVDYDAAAFCACPYSIPVPPPIPCSQDVPMTFAPMPENYSYDD